MASPPSISIAIPSYNRRSSLASLLAATVEQLEDDDELIVVDDGSSDDSAHEVLKFESLSPDPARGQPGHGQSLERLPEERVA